MEEKLCEQTKPNKSTNHERSVILNFLCVSMLLDNRFTQLLSIKGYVVISYTHEHLNDLFH